MKQLPISLLIPTMNRPDSLKRTLSTYFMGDSYPMQLIVVDQSQNINTANENKMVVKSFSDKCNVRYIYQAEPSLTKARNNAFQYATEEIVLCSDDDVDVYKNTLNNVYQIMSDDKIAMLGGINDNEQAASTNIGYLLGTKSYKNRNIGHVTLSVLGRFPNEIHGQVDTMWTMGFFFAIKKSLKDRWNIEWDENLTSYAYAEDLDFSYSYYKKAQQEGLRCIFSSDVHVKHMVTKEYRTPTKKQCYMYVLNREYIRNKHMKGFKSRLAIQWCDFWRLIERILTRKNPKDFALAMLYSQWNKEKVWKGQFPY